MGKVIIKKNPDAAQVTLIEKALKENDNYCPCQLERNEDTRCICKMFKEQKEGLCHCGRFVKIIKEEE